jgi:hypothetical protein
VIALIVAQVGVSVAQRQVCKPGGHTPSGCRQGHSCPPCSRSLHHTQNAAAIAHPGCQCPCAVPTWSLACSCAAHRPHHCRLHPPHPPPHLHRQHTKLRGSTCEARRQGGKGRRHICRGRVGEAEGHASCHTVAIRASAGACNAEVMLMPARQPAHQPAGRPVHCCPALACRQQANCLPTGAPPVRSPPDSFPAPPQPPSSSTMRRSTPASAMAASPPPPLPRTPLALSSSEVLPGGANTPTREGSTRCGAAVTEGALRRTTSVGHVNSSHRCRGGGRCKHASGVRAGGESDTVRIWQCTSVQLDRSTSRPV